MNADPEERETANQEAEVAILDKNQQDTTKDKIMAPAAGEDAVGKVDTSKPTIGEELFLVHLSRDKGDTPDYDHESRKKRSRSIGDELWEVHLKRSKGCAPDLDTEDPIKKEDTPVKAKDTKKKTRPKAVTKGVGCSGEKVYHLRTRDVMIR